MFERETSPKASCGLNWPKLIYIINIFDFMDNLTPTFMIYMITMHGNYQLCLVQKQGYVTSAKAQVVLLAGWIAAFNHNLNKALVLLDLTLVVLMRPGARLHILERTRQNLNPLLTFN